MKFCPSCHIYLEDKFTFCHQCGGKLQEKVDRFFCPSCGKKIATDVEFCPFCGSSLTSDPILTTPSLSKVVKFCSNCQLNYYERYSFCQKCGSSLQVKGKEQIILNGEDKTETENGSYQFPENTITDTKTDDSSFSYSGDTDNIDIVDETESHRATAINIKSVIMGIIVLLIISVSVLNLDNTINWFNANKAMAFNVFYTTKLRDLRRDYETTSGLSPEKRKEIVDGLIEYEYERDIAADEYKDCHQVLVNNDSILKDYDKLVVLFSGFF